MLKNLVIWLVIGLVLMTVFNQFNTRQQTQAVMRPAFTSSMNCE